MPSIKKSMDDWIRALQSCDEVKHFRDLSEQIRTEPQKEKRLSEFRKKSYQLQISDGDMDVIGESERLLHDYEDLFRDPLTSEYLSAEASLLRMLQQVNRRMLACLDFYEIPAEEEPKE